MKDVGKGVVEGVAEVEEQIETVPMAALGVTLGQALPLLQAETASLAESVTLGVRTALVLGLELVLSSADGEACRD